MARDSQCFQMAGEAEVLEDFSADGFMTANLLIDFTWNEQALSEESRLVGGVTLHAEGVDSRDHDDVEEGGEFLVGTSDLVVGTDGNHSFHVVR